MFDISPLYPSLSTACTTKAKECLFGTMVRSNSIHFYFHKKADHYEILYAHTSQEIYDHRNKMTLLKRVQQTDLVQGSLYFPRISGETEIFKINTTTMAPLLTIQNSITKIKRELSCFTTMMNI
jgi:aspartokinase-like uncharacterized kinase